MTSSCLCKKAEGVAQQLLRGLQVLAHTRIARAPSRARTRIARAPSRARTRIARAASTARTPVLIESVKDGIEDSLHALHVGEQDHGPGAPADFHEAGSAPGVNWVVTGPTPLVFV